MNIVRPSAPPTLPKSLLLQQEENACRGGMLIRLRDLFNLRPSQEQVVDYCLAIRFARAHGCQDVAYLLFDLRQII